MSVKKVEYLDDRLRVHYHFSQCPGVPDDGILDITYESVANLKLLSKKEVGVMRIFIHKCNKTVVLIENSWPETSAGERMYEYIPRLG